MARRNDPIVLLSKLIARPLVPAMAIGAIALYPSASAAQASGSRAVVQALPSEAQKELSEALSTLALDSRSVPALVKAGRASLALDDLDAAEGFFARADTLAPQAGAIKAGKASVLARRGQAVEALKLFDEAESLGEPMLPYAADRGLSYDLVGDNALAQRQYSQALVAGSDEEVSRRLAISQAIAGDQRGMDATLLPMLQRQDLAAYRTRAFALAIMGKSDEAVSIAETLLPPRLSSRMAPYLRYMPRLTRPQQAAAANLGVFPRAAEIGRDDPALAAYSSQPAPRPTASSQSADARLRPAGEPLGPRANPAPQSAQAVPPSAAPVERAAPPPQARPVAPPQSIAAAEPPRPAPQPQVATAPAPEPARPSIALDEVRTQQVAATPAITAPAPAPAPPPEPVSLQQAFAGFTTEARITGPAAGAVDITRIKPTIEDRRMPEPPPPPPPPPEPSRYWVQVATGRDAKALGFDWRRIKREAGGLLDKSKPYVVDWGQTNRMVTGPFPDAGSANEMVRSLKAKGLDTFRFQSAEGEKVRPLG